MDPRSNVNVAYHERTRGMLELHTSILAWISLAIVDVPLLDVPLRRMIWVANRSTGSWALCGGSIDDRNPLNCSLLRARPVVQLDISSGMLRSAAGLDGTALAIFHNLRSAMFDRSVSADQLRAMSNALF